MHNHSYLPSAEEGWGAFLERVCLPYYYDSSKPTFALYLTSAPHQGDYTITVIYLQPQARTPQSPG